MSRFVSYTCNALTALSLLLCVGAVALRVRGVRTADYVQIGYWNRHPHPRYGKMGIGTATRLSILHHEGRLAVGLITGGCIDRLKGPVRPGPGEHGEHVCWTHPASAAEAAYLERLPQIPETLPDPRAQRGSVALQDRWLILASSLLPAGRLLHRRLRRRAAILTLETCSVCGYDLRATPNRCPECGTIPAAAGRQTFAGHVV